MSSKLKLRVISLFILSLLVILAFLPAAGIKSDAADHGYVKTGLKALYLGNNNTGSGQNISSTTWKDLSGNKNDIKDLTKDDKNYFTKTGFNLESSKYMFPQAVADIVNGNEFTVELVLGDLKPLGSGFNTFINCGNDYFSLFRRVDGDFIEFKNGNNSRPKVTGGEDFFKNSTISITFKKGTKCILYVDGVQIGEGDAKDVIGADNLWFGHPENTRNFKAIYHSMRFYNVALSADQVAANAKQDKATFFGGTGTESSAAEASSNTTVSSDTSKPAESSSAEVSKPDDKSNPTSNVTSATSATQSSSPKENEKDSGNVWLWVGIGAAVVVAAVIAFFIFRKKK